MKTTEFRTLTAEELEMEKGQKRNRTDYERRAYRWLPDGMKKCAQRNPGIAFEGHCAFYPDLFFPEQKLCIEIDGSVHLCQQGYDARRERIFKKHGYEVIRVDNADTIEDIAFWQCLLQELKKIKELENRILLKDFISELQQAINNKWNSMLNIDDYDDSYVTDDFVAPLMTHKLMQRRLHHGDSLIL